MDKYRNIYILVGHYTNILGKTGWKLIMAVENGTRQQGFADHRNLKAEFKAKY